MTRYIKYNTKTSGRFSRIPDEFKQEPYSSMSSHAKLLYSYILQNAECNAAAGKVEKNGVIYANYSRKQMETDLSLAPETVRKALKELLEAKLLCEKRIGLGMVNRIYPLVPLSQKASGTSADLPEKTEAAELPEVEELPAAPALEEPKTEEHEAEETTAEEIQGASPSALSEQETAERTFAIPEKYRAKFGQRSEMTEKQMSERQKVADEYYKQDYYNTCIPSPTPSRRGEDEEVKAFVESIRIAGTQTQKKAFVNGAWQTPETIRDRFTRLTAEAVQHVADLLISNADDIRNTRKYAFTVLFNFCERNTQTTAAKPKKPAFFNFTEREYNYAELMELLA